MSEKLPSSKDARPPSLDIVFQEVKSRLDKQFDQIEALTNRAAFLMGFATLVLGSLLSIRRSMGDLDLLKLVLLLIAVGIYSVVLLFSLLSYRLQDYRRAPEPRHLRDEYLMKAERLTMRRVVTSFIESFEHNEEIIIKRARYLRISIYSVFALIAYLVFLLLVFNSASDNSVIQQYLAG